MRTTRTPERPSTPLSSRSSDTTDLLKSSLANTLTGDLDAFVRSQAPHSGRRQDVIHPSELVKSDWCPRAEYRKIRLARDGYDLPAETVRLWLQNIFDEGHDIHEKWQQRIWSLGYLAGEFDCLRCKHASADPTRPVTLSEYRWWSVSPKQCPRCSAPRELLRYAEVLVDGFAEFLIVGRADGRLEPSGEGRRVSILEVKSVGAGTVRIENPKLLSEFTFDIEDDDRRVTDFDRLFRAVRHPFATHIKQAGIYGYITGVDHLSFLYESKMTQAFRVFDVRVSVDVVEPLLEKAVGVKDALDRSRPPTCVNPGNCGKCAIIDDFKDALYAAQSSTGRPGRAPGQQQVVVPGRRRLVSAGRPLSA